MSIVWPDSQTELFLLGRQLVNMFCAANQLPVPNITNSTTINWNFQVCAFYRPDTPTNRKWTIPGINICLEKCQTPARPALSRNWTWPGSTTDREPVGVLAHELGHHVDWHSSTEKGTYFGNYSIDTRAASGEKPITSYCENDAEWFAEIFRLFITNHLLLQQLRPKTYDILRARWTPVHVLHLFDPDDTTVIDWRTALGTNAPERIITNLVKKGAVEPQATEPD